MVLGWLIAAGSGALVMFGLLYLAFAFTGHGIPAPLGPGFAVAMGIFIAGLALVQCCLVARAVFDIADNAQPSS